MIGLLMFACALLLLLFGFPVAFTFAAVAVVFALATDNMHLFAMMPHRVFAIMNNTTLMAVPLFIYMGVVLQKSGLAERLLESMGRLFGNVRGGITVSTVIVGAILAASTGVVGASVVAMAVIALPVMLRYGYSPRLSAGTICASGTLGQIIPPSVILIILGEVLQVPVGELFRAAFLPGISLAGAYIVFLLVYAFFRPHSAPAIPPGDQPRAVVVRDAFRAIIPPFVLILLVLGSIFFGIATPTESAAVGACASIGLSLLYKRFSLRMVYESAMETAKVTSMVFAILIGATAFSMVFSYTGGEQEIHDFLFSIPGGEVGFLLFSMALIFALGFFIDFVEICYIVVPVLAPVAAHLGLDKVWFAIIIAMNLQTSFLTPPFGFSLFYLKGAAPHLSTADIYRGVVPFIALQLFVLAVVILFPELFVLHSK